MIVATEDFINTRSHGTSSTNRATTNFYTATPKHFVLKRGHHELRSHVCGYGNLHFPKFRQNKVTYS